MHLVTRPDRVAHRVAFETAALREAGVTTAIGSARALTERGVLSPHGGKVWTDTTVARLMARVGGSAASVEL